MLQYRHVQYKSKAITLVHKYINTQSTTVSVPSSELGLPLLHLPRNLKGGRGSHSPARVRGCGNPQFRRLEKKLSTLPTLCIGVTTILTVYGLDPEMENKVYSDFKFIQFFNSFFSQSAKCKKSANKILKTFSLLSRSCKGACRDHLATGQLALWLERLAPYQEDTSFNPLWRLGALTEGGNILGVRSFYSGDLYVVLLCLACSILSVWIRQGNARSLAHHWQTILLYTQKAVPKRYGGGSYAGKSAETKINNRLASSLVRAPNS